ncbi:MAG: hypothetical protein IE891_05070 [Flavobacteriaceae bacterium]|nr:hypothetical protein [Flavobacteriaceae bacterium]
MKKLKFLFTISIVITIMFTFSCSENESINSTSSLRQPELGEIKFKSNIDNNSSKLSTGKIIIIDIARKKHSDDPKVCGDCKCGLGVCRFCMFCTRSSENSQTVEIFEENGIKFFELELSEPLLEGVDYNFYVDEDVYCDDDSNLYVEKGVYELNQDIGEFGGYKIIVSY